MKTNKRRKIMKKFLSIILTLTLAASFAACGKKGVPVQKETSKVTDTDKNVDSSVESAIDSSIDSALSEETTEEAEKDQAPQKESTNPEKETKPSNNQNAETKPETKPEVKPEAEPKPEAKPEAKPEPETKPEAKPESGKKTVGNTLLADFKSKAASMDALSLADSLLTNPIIQFGGASMSVEPGYLTGFDNAEIKGFSEGAMFAPMIGSIAFVGYVFTLEDGTDTAAFISNLKANANKRWNICTEADEMVTGSVGNKVFFVMCPSSFDQE